MRGPISKCLAAALVILLLPASKVFSQAKQGTLRDVDQEYSLLRAGADARILEYVRANPGARVAFTARKTSYLMVDVTTSGVPVYIKTFNQLEAITLNVPALRAGGSLGLNLLGTGIRLAIWDGGRVRGDHVELTGRVTQVDGSSALSDHATHTSGTMLASGVNPNAKGMAPEATLSAFDYNNDVSEMASQASTLLISNHSYGALCGWDTQDGSTYSWHGDPAVSSSVDYKFGFYDSQANQWDAISFNAPFYLIVKAAGNDRGEFNGAGPQVADGSPNGFDCIPTYGVAKNILTVGAVQNLTSYTSPSDVLMTSFSSWGPTDDGRIKPDLVAPGFQVFSSIASSSTAYSNENGTSMASPATAGTLALLQQLYKSLNSGNAMRSATLKALVLHTAREAGLNPGPDYAFGWGLLDAKGAADVIIKKDNQNVFINEAVLTSGQVYELNLGVPKAGTKITATLVWTDPAATPPAPSLNPVTKMLINDLDLRLVDDGGTQQFPWILNPANPSAAATRADNIRDNVEKLEFSNPDPRIYKLQVKNKGNLQGGQQAFSLILTYSSQVDPKITYYWIGNSGTWNDAAHWSLSSGGVTAGVVPGADDRVVFDENSFSLDNQSVSLSGNQSCYSLRWFAQEPTGFSLTGNTLTIGESMTFLTDNVTTPTSGTLLFNSASSTANTVDLDANVFDNLTLNFNGTSSWTITGNASVNQLMLTQGTLNFSESDLRINQLVPSGGSAKTVSFLSSSIKALQNLTIDFTGMTIQSDNLSSIIISPTVTNLVTLGPGNFQGFVNLQGGDVSISGTGIVRSIQGNGIARLNGGLHVTNLTLSGGSQLVLQSGTNSTFTDNFIFSTSPTSRVTVKASAAANATLTFDDYYKICVNNIDVQNVDVTGTAVVNAGPGSTLLNSANWLKTNCADILFPDFEVSFPCVKSAAYFTDKSSGPITSRSWDFGDPSSPQNTSTLASPIHYFTGNGPYTVIQTVSGTGGLRSISKQVTLQPNVLPDNSVQWNNNNLISTIVAQSYQWLKDGLVIPSATSRFYSPGTGGGEYTVLIFDANCNKRSSAFIITAIEDEVIAPVKELKVYPNPTSEVLQIETGSPLVAVSMLDVIGRETRLEAEKMDGDRYRVNVSAVSSGLYILKVTTLERVELKKVVIRK